MIYPLSSVVDLVFGGEKIRLVSVYRNGEALDLAEGGDCEVDLSWPLGHSRVRIALSAKCFAEGDCVSVVSKQHTAHFVVGPPRVGGSVLADKANEPSVFRTDLEHPPGQWENVLIRFTSGKRSGQVRWVNGHGVRGFLVLATPLSSTPDPGDTFVLVNG